jgi:hypothetical protein
MRVLTRYGLFLAVATMWALAMTACGRPPASPPAPATTATAVSATAEPFVPGLGELMSLQQMRHVKLWLAGKAGNWKLASYEVDELGEGFADVIKLHPTHKDSPVAPKDVIPLMMKAPLEDLRQAVEKHDAKAFTEAYDELTTACNSCHEATNFGFNHVQRPATNPYPNQVFEPAKR